MNLVEVRVVVRDAQGHAVSNLKKGDFQLLDDGKPQTITKFSAEQPGPPPVIQREISISNAGENPGQAPPPALSVPKRYIAYLFDDVHLQFGSLARARTAAEHHLEALLPTERAAIYTTSGQTQIEFTDDHDRLRDILSRLMPRPITGSGTNCPHMSYYMADMIQNREDTQALSAATLDAVDCAFEGRSGPGIMSAAEEMARNAARQRLYFGAHETQVTFDTLRQVVGRIAALPGERTIILVSPGFLNPEQQQEEVEIEDRALHANIVINTMDARGLYMVGDDASKSIPPRHLNSIAQNIDELYLQYSEREKSAQADVLREMANATGGKFFHNSNDLGEGFRQLAGTPDYSYVLGFSPQDLKPDGSFHTLKVTLKGGNFDIQARQGYYAPKPASDAMAQAKRKFEPSVFSPARKNLAEAQQLLARGKDLNKAMELLRKAIKQDPAEVQAYLLMGAAYSSQNNWNEAEKSFRKALDLNHANAPAYIGLGAVENEKNNFPEAEKNLLRALELAPESADAHFELGRTYFGLGRWDAADQHVSKANQLRASNPQQHLLLGDIMLRERNAEGALKEFQEALRLDPTGPMAQPTQQMIARIEAALRQQAAVSTSEMQVNSIPKPLPPQNNAANVIQSQIDGEFTGWEGETVFKLANGQIWQQAEDDYTDEDANRPSVMIYKTAQCWKMKVEGVDDTICVKRLK